MEGVRNHNSARALALHLLAMEFVDGGLSSDGPSTNELQAFLEKLSLQELGTNLRGHPWQHWVSLPRVELLEALRTTGLSLSQRQKFANAFYRALREDRVVMPSPGPPALPPAPPLNMFSPTAFEADNDQTRSRNAIIYGRIGTCLPNAPIPNVPLPPPPSHLGATQLGDQVCRPSLNRKGLQLLPSFHPHPTPSP